MGERGCVPRVDTVDRSEGDFTGKSGRGVEWRTWKRRKIMTGVSRGDGDRFLTIRTYAGNRFPGSVGERGTSKINSPFTLARFNLLVPHFRGEDMRILHDRTITTARGICLIFICISFVVASANVLQTQTRGTSPIKTR